MRWNRRPINTAFVFRTLLYAAFCGWATYAWSLRLFFPDAVAGVQFVIPN